MPLPFVAGAATSATEFRQSLGEIAILGQDVSVVTSTTSEDCPGLSVPVEQRNVYAIEAYIAWNAGTTGQMKIGMSAPADNGGDWVFLGNVDGLASSVGDIAPIRREQFNVGNLSDTEAGTSGSGGPMAAQIFGWLLTYRMPGVVQVRFSQLTSNATATTVKAGSWLRVSKMN